MTAESKQDPVAAICKVQPLFVFRGYNSGSFTWNIRDENLIKNILNAQNGDLFESEDFTMSKLHWKLKLFPNGKKSSNHGNVIICLTLLSMPSELDKITCSYAMRCNHSLSSHTSMAIFTKSGQNKALPDKALLLSEWQSMNLNNISISVTIKINSIVLNDSSNYLKLSNLTQSYHPNDASYTNSSQFVYEIDNKTMHLLRESHNGKTFESEIYDNMFRLRVYPNGETIKNKGYICVYLKLCVVPPFITKINVKYNIKCDETNASYSGNKEFSIKKLSDGEKKFMRLEEIESLQSMRFMIDIEILNVEFVDKEYDLHNVYDSVQIDKILASVSVEDEIQSVSAMDSVNARLNTLCVNMEQNNSMIKTMQNNINQLMKQIYDIQSVIGTRKNNMELDEKVSTDHDDEEIQSSMEQWLKYTVKLPQYTPLFKQNGLEDISTIKCITMNELTMIGLDIVGHRIKIINEIEKLNK